jgi:calcineurin-like phosphoesterase family protein
MAIWFTADTHFNHANVIKYSRRPFASLEEMTERLIANWNKYVQAGDTIYHLGDFALSWGRKSEKAIDDILRRLQGNKWLICGNHDRDEVTRNRHWTKVVDYHEIRVATTDEDKQRIVLCHYSMRVWNQSHRGAWMLHGHSHGNLADIGGKTMDIGVDCHEYRPVSLNFLTETMRRRPIVAVDHHTSI